MLIHDNKYLENLEIFYSTRLERLKEIQSLEFKQRFAEVKNDFGFAPVLSIKDFLTHNELLKGKIMEIEKYIAAKNNREASAKIQLIKEGKYRLYVGVEEKQEYSLLDKDRFRCFLEKELQILDDEFNKL